MFDIGFFASIYHQIKNPNRIKYYNLLRKRDRLSLEELKIIQLSRLKLLVKHCYNNIPYYRELFRKNDIRPEDIKSLKDYSRIPVLTKDNIREHFNELINPALSKSEIIYDSTSGSTGIPLKLVRSVDDQDYGFALRYRSNAWCGWNYTDKSVWFVSDTRHISDVEQVKGRFRYWLMNRLVLNTRNITRNQMESWVKQIKQFKPEQVYGYSSLLAEFAHFVLEKGYTFKGIKGVFSTSEVLINRKLISEAFNAPVYDQYGASEIPCIAHECKDGNMHLNIDEVVVEFEDTIYDSDIKKMVCTPLYLYGMPLLRYDILDCAIPVKKSCTCGLSYPIIELKVGRLSDNLLSSSGKLVSGITLSWYITEATKGLYQYEIIQEDFYNFRVRLVTSDAYKTQNEQSIRELLSEMLSMQDIRIKFEYPERILPGKNGKYRPITSKVVNVLSEEKI